MSQLDTIIKWAKNQLGSNEFNTRCQRFVATAYSKAGLPYGDAGSARDAYNRWCSHKKGAIASIPAGAAVYFYSPKYPQWGHVGLSLGGDTIIHAFGKVKYGSVSSLNASGYTYLGWGWNCNRQPSGASSGGSGVETGYSGDSADSSSSSSEVVVIHTPQVEKMYTLYDDDNRQKKPDKYKLVWKPYGGTARDITELCSEIIYTDDSSAVCTELSFAIVGSYKDKYLKPIGIMPGDEVCVNNISSGLTIFIGRVETVAGDYSSAVQVSCADNGCLLTRNEIILQCNNIAAKTAISAAANAVGILDYVCPNLISSVYETYKEPAGDIISGILETVTAENGVDYFPRMMGDTLVIRSFAEKPITPWHRPADNLPAFRCLDEPSQPSLTLSSENLKNQVIVYSEKDSSVSVLASEKDAESIRHYGLRQAVEAYSDNSGVTAAAKAKTLLAKNNTLQETVSLSCYGSDAVVAGARLTLDLEEAKGDYWVVSVSHTLGSTHTMSMELRRCR